MDIYIYLSFLTKIMPYKCVHCAEFYDDGSQELLIGCKNCGRKFFFYIKKEKFELMQQMQKQEEIVLTEKEKNQMEEDVRQIAGIENEEVPVFLEFESVSIVKPGKYLIDLTKLFAQNKPRIYKLEDGKYIVDMSSSSKNKNNSII